MSVLEWIGLVFVIAGLIFILIGIFGMMKYNNLFIRLSISSLIDTAGFILVMVGLIFISEFRPIAIKIGLLLAFMLLLNPLSSHSIGRGAFSSGYHPERKRKQ